MGSKFTARHLERTHANDFEREVRLSQTAPHGVQLDSVLQEAVRQGPSRRFLKVVLRSSPVPREIGTGELRSHRAAKGGFLQLQLQLQLRMRMRSTVSSKRQPDRAHSA